MGVRHGGLGHLWIKPIVIYKRALSPLPFLDDPPGNCRALLLIVQFSEVLIYLLSAETVDTWYVPRIHRTSIPQKIIVLHGLPRIFT